jgi:phosphoadenosine phosphosulfate reductase
MTTAVRAGSAGLDRCVAALESALRAIALEHAPAAFASSLGAEDMVLTDVILRAQISIEIFTLDTGRLHPETLELLDRVRERYGYAIRVYRPDEAAVDGYVREFGLDALYQSVELRSRCCHIRKVEPLNRALAGKKGWVTGMRRAQSVTRKDLPLEEFDSGYRLWKFNPLAEWSEREVWDYIRGLDVPYNPLHDQGFRSIGCAPCTRPTAAGEDLRAGRWWWENPENKECGLHKHPSTEASADASPVEQRNRA